MVGFSILLVWVIVFVHPKPLMNILSFPPLDRTSPTGRMTLMPLLHNERATNVHLVTYALNGSCLDARFVCEVVPEARDIETEGDRRFLLAPECSNTTENAPYVRQWNIILTRTDGTERVVIVDLPAREPITFFRRLPACPSQHLL